MEIGLKLRELRKGMRFSQGDIEKRAGLLQCYVSRVEKGRTIPSVETLEKFAGALEIPLYRFFTDGDEADVPKLRTTRDDSAWRIDGKHRRELRLVAKAFKRMDERKQKLLLDLAKKMADRRKRV
jgi:transcriptional regulator with XRE-family HTH domain